MQSRYIIDDVNQYVYTRKFHNANHFYSLLTMPQFRKKETNELRSMLWLPSLILRTLNYYSQ